MRTAGRLISLGARPEQIIDKTFYKKTFLQNKILGTALCRAELFLDGKIIASYIMLEEMEKLKLSGKDLDGIIDQLRLTEGVECALFLYESGAQEYKVSMRSQDRVDVSRIATFFGGGGHVHAAGCTMSGSIHDVINNLAIHISRQLSPDTEADQQ